MFQTAELARKVVPQSYQSLRREGDLQQPALIVHPHFAGLAIRALQCVVMRADGAAVYSKSIDPEIRNIEALLLAGARRDDEQVVVTNRHGNEVELVKNVVVEQQRAAVEHVFARGFAAASTFASSSTPTWTSVSPWTIVIGMRTAAASAGGSTSSALRNQ